MDRIAIAEIINTFHKQKHTSKNICFATKYYNIPVKEDLLSHRGRK